MAYVRLLQMFVTNSLLQACLLQTVRICLYPNIQKFSQIFRKHSKEKFCVSVDLQESGGQTAIFTKEPAVQKQLISQFLRRVHEDVSGTVLGSKGRRPGLRSFHDCFKVSSPS